MVSYDFSDLEFTFSKYKLGKFTGVQIALFELSLFFIISTLFYNFFTISFVCYYWYTFTILTGIWEYTYIKNKKNIICISQQLIQCREHVWTNKYHISTIFPWNLSKIFYAEYAAYADREYMSKNDDWSTVIEGTHALYCALFALFALYYNFTNNTKNYYITLSISMGTQLMNSILYISEYLIQIKTSSNINYNSEYFPTGRYLLRRPFFYINFVWTILPSYILLYNLIL